MSHSHLSFNITDLLILLRLFCRLSERMTMSFKFSTPNNNWPAAQMLLGLRHMFIPHEGLLRQKTTSVPRLFALYLKKPIH